MNSDLNSFQIPSIQQQEDFRLAQQFPVSNGRSDSQNLLAHPGAVQTSKDYGNRIAQINTATASNRAPATAAASDAASIGKDFGELAVSGLSGTLGLGLVAAGSVISSGLNFATEQRKLDFEQKNWDAAKQAGLLSPAQFGTLSGGPFLSSRGTGSSLNVSGRTSRNAPTGFTL